MSLVERITNVLMSPQAGSRSTARGANEPPAPAPASATSTTIEQPQHHEQTNRSAIQDFYQNRSVLITGGSGFIGKVLIEKLLRDCPGIRRIFVLIRPKWNKKPHERLKELLGSPLFDGVRRRGIQVEEKVLLVEGDVTEPHLGLSEQNLLRIMNEVSVIYHSAATVKFDEPLKQSIGINIAGVKNMIEICRKIPQLAALVHVSTAYANCDKQEEIDEHIYPVGQLDPERLIEMANWLDQDTLQQLKLKLLGPRPNTYTYTKALAEWLLIKSARDLPVVICRPSIVVASAREPFPGWIDNCNGPTGIILGTGKGLVRTMLAQKSYVADLVPVDSVINLIVTLGWFAHVYQNHKQFASHHELIESQTESLLGSDSASADAESLDGSDDHHQRVLAAAAAATTTTPNDKESRPTSHHDGQCNGNGGENNNNSSPHFVHHLANSNNTDLSGNSCSSISVGTSEKKMMTNGHSERLHLLEVIACASDGCDNHHRGRINNHNHQHHHDDGYATQSPDYRSPSASSSSSCSLINDGGAKRISSPIPPSPSPNTQQCETTTTTTTRTQNKNDVDDDNNSFGGCDCNYNLEGCNQLTEGEKYQSFVTQRRLAEQEHAAFEYKLKQFRHDMQLKLAAKNLPEELADIPVFHCTSGADNPISWGQIQVLTLAALTLFPSLQLYRYPNAAFTSRRRLDLFYHWTLHLIPAYLADIVLRLLGKKATMVKIFRKYEQAAQVLNAFTMKEWRFSPRNRLLLYSELLSSEDRKLFNCDVASLNWAEFFKDYALGVRQYILKEPQDTIERARASQRLTYYRNSALQILFAAMIAYFFLA